MLNREENLLSLRLAVLADKVDKLERQVAFLDGHIRARLKEEAETRKQSYVSEMKKNMGIFE